MARLSRRQALTALGSVSLGSVLAACGGNGASPAGTPTAVPTEAGPAATVAPTTATDPGLAARFDAAATCSVAAELTEGPYYFDVDSIRSDIREDRQGTPLTLAVRVREAGTCAPLPDAVVDVWHCDAGGLYSGFESASRGGPGGGRSDEETYLRGAQVTNRDGIVQFTTVYPGWYRGRAVHIHAKVHLDRTTLLTTQFFFDEATTAAVYAAEPYSATGTPDTTNATDGIFDPSLVLSLSEEPGDEGRLGLITHDLERA
jgi:protocatechuate 3,4-dioxygenase beta subunit